MTTIEMLNSIAQNNFKNPKSADWKKAEIPAASNFCTHLEKAWISYMKGMTDLANADQHFDNAQERMSAALSSLDLVVTRPMVERLKGLCQIKKVNGKLRYTSKTTFRKNAMMYLYDCVNGESMVELDEKLEKALNPKAKTSKKLSAEEKRAREIKKMVEQAKSLSDDERNMLMEAMKMAA